MKRGSEFAAEIPRRADDGVIARLDPLVDPRWDDVGDDSASPKRRSLLAIAGSLLVEISLPKLLLAATVLLVLPAVLLGVAPPVASAWLASASERLSRLSEFGAVLAGIVLIGLGWIAWRPLLRTAEANFWSLNALAVQPAYALFREALRHIADGVFSQASASLTRARVRAVSSAGAGLLLSGCAVLIFRLVWPASRWIGTINELTSPHRLLVPTLANALVLLSGYMVIAALVWGIADASMDQPQELPAFDTAPRGGSRWRIAHLADIHVVGERYGFRIESGRSGPRGNGRMLQLMSLLETIQRAQPLDLVLICGDLTDAGRATEWAEFMDAVARHPSLAARMVIIPGNHDLNIVDPANPARLDLPFSIGKRLRQMRTLVAMAALQGDRVRVIDPRSGQPARTLNEALAPHWGSIRAFMEDGGLRRIAELRGLFEAQFPMILPPQTPEGLGIALLNSNASTHFSFTNALGWISLEQSRRLAAAALAYPKARWIIALHHHLVEYPMAVAAFSERIGTALVNGSWFVRKLAPFAERAVVMHGHRHIDWIGACGDLKIVSAPSPVMGTTDDGPTHFHIHTLAAASNGKLLLLAPERMEVAGADGPTVH